MLCTELNKSGFRTKTAFEDADLMIVNSAIEHARMESDTTVVLVGQDIDLLVILCQNGYDHSNIYFFKEGKGREPNKSVSYTHLDVYKRQDLMIPPKYQMRIQR